VPRRTQIIQKSLFYLIKCHTYRLYLLTATNPTPATITERKTQKAKLFYVVNSTLLKTNSHSFGRFKYILDHHLTVKQRAGCKLGPLKSTL